MKKMKKIYWMLFIILCAACNDPYDGDTYVVFDMQPAGTYLSNRSDDFSEWIHIMKYADLYNAVNQATQSFTLFVPSFCFYLIIVTFAHYLEENERYQATI